MNLEIDREVQQQQQQQQQQQWIGFDVMD